MTAQPTAYPRRRRWHQIGEEWHWLVVITDQEPIFFPASFLFNRQAKSFVTKGLREFKERIRQRFESSVGFWHVVCTSPCLAVADPAAALRPQGVTTCGLAFHPGPEALIPPQRPRYPRKGFCRVGQRFRLPSSQLL